VTRADLGYPEGVEEQHEHGQLLLQLEHDEDSCRDWGGDVTRILAATGRGWAEPK
jgi:hypothetical protein